MVGSNMTNKHVQLQLDWDYYKLHLCVDTLDNVMRRKLILLKTHKNIKMDCHDPTLHPILFDSGL